MEGSYDVRDRVFLITGGDKGLGLETVRRLVSGGGRVVIGCRDSRYFTHDSDHHKHSLCSSLRCGDDQIQLLHLDLSVLESVVKFCEDVQSQFDKIGEHKMINMNDLINVILDVVICNAGVMCHDPDSSVSSDGLETHFSVNYLGHCLIVKKLRLMLNKSSDPRVVFVSSTLLKTGHIDFDYLGSSSDPRYRCDGSNRTPPAYCDTKLMAALFIQVMKTFSSFF